MVCYCAALPSAVIQVVWEEYMHHRNGRLSSPGQLVRLLSPEVIPGSVHPFSWGPIKNTYAADLSPAHSKEASPARPQLEAEPLAEPSLDQPIHRQPREPWVWEQIVIGWADLGVSYSTLLWQWLTETHGKLGVGQLVYLKRWDRKKKVKWSRPSKWEANGHPQRE